VFLRFGSWLKRQVWQRLPATRHSFRSAMSEDQAGAGKKRRARGTLRDLSQMELLMSSGGMQTDQFSVAARLLADIKEMYHLPGE